MKYYMYILLLGDPGYPGSPGVRGESGQIGNTSNIAIQLAITIADSYYA